MIKGWQAYGLVSNLLMTVETVVCNGFTSSVMVSEIAAVCGEGWLKPSPSITSNFQQLNQNARE